MNDANRYSENSDVAIEEEKDRGEAPLVVGAPNPVDFVAESEAVIIQYKA